MVSSERINVLPKKRRDMLSLQRLFRQMPVGNEADLVKPQPLGEWPEIELVVQQGDW
jgi:hypothetical protein